MIPSIYNRPVEKALGFIDRVMEYIRKTPVANIGSISKLLPDRNYAYILVNHLLKKGRMERITREYYTVYDEPSLLVYCLKPGSKLHSLL